MHESPPWGCRESVRRAPSRRIPTGLTTGAGDQQRDRHEIHPSSTSGSPRSPTTSRTRRVLERAAAQGDLMTHPELRKWTPRCGRRVKAASIAGSTDRSRSCVDRLNGTALIGFARRLATTCAGGQGGQSSRSRGIPLCRRALPRTRSSTRDGTISRWDAAETVQQARRSLLGTPRTAVHPH